VDVGPTREVLSRHPDADSVIDARGKVVMPGFVDPHTHLIFAGSREGEVPLKVEGTPYGEIARRGGGILSTVEATRRASEDELFALARERLDRMLAQGTTTAEVKSGYGLRTADELKILRVAARLSREHAVEIVPTFLGAHALPKEYEGRAEDYVEYVLHEMLPALGPRLARFCDVFVERGFFTVDQARRVLSRAKEMGLGVKVHADELSQGGGAELAAEVGAVSADHLIHVSDGGLRAMASRGVVGVLLPGTPFTSPGLPFPDGRRIVEAGVPLALGTDLNPNAWLESMQLVLAMASYRLRLFPAEAIAAATINAAAALGLGDRLGSLEVGKQADLLLVEAENHLHLPYRLGTNLVQTVVKKGVVVWRALHT
jgi:imidazolonepropionase